ncbi:hypothetical protein Zmor_008954, partial [Zophobas morio]
FNFLINQGGKWVVPNGMNTGITLYNSLTRSQVPLYIPLNNTCHWYMCGPTVYNISHIGHACTYLRWDILRRILTDYFKINVVSALGITDIDDKIISVAEKLNCSALSIARKYENLFFKDMTSFNILEPFSILRVSEHIDDIIRFIEKLILSGKAYQLEGSVYFDTEVHGGRYGKLFPEALLSEYPPGKKNLKKNERDFALWKSGNARELKIEGALWDSPWGKGRPGWHVECSAMASSLFGKHLDIHSGGRDLLYPHHENELAQSEAFHAVDQWANYWLHFGLVNLHNEKMSKSSNCFVSVQEFLKSYFPDHLRMLCLLFKYNSVINYSDDALKEAIVLVERLQAFLCRAQNVSHRLGIAYIYSLTNHLVLIFVASINLACGTVRFSPRDLKFKETLMQTKSLVHDYLKSDFDTPKAVRQVFKLINAANNYLQEGPNSTDFRISIAAAPVRPAVNSLVISECFRYVISFFSMLGLRTLRSAFFSEQSELEKQFLSFRSVVRSISLAALKKRDLENGGYKDLLKECDRLRDEVFSKLGIFVEVFASLFYCYKTLQSFI